MAPEEIVDLFGKMELVASISSIVCVYVGMDDAFANVGTLMKQAFGDQSPSDIAWLRRSGTSIYCHY